MSVSDEPWTELQEFRVSNSELGAVYVQWLVYKQITNKNVNILNYD